MVGGLLTRLRDRSGPAAQAMERPQLATDVAVHEPIEPGQPWVAQRGTREYLRIGKDLARLMQAMDGQRTTAELAALLGPPWSAETVEQVVRQLAEKKLLADGRRRRRSTAPWVKYVPPITLQITLLRPAGAAKALAPIASAVASRWGMTTCWVFALAGVLAMVVQAQAIGDALSSPLPFEVYLLLLASSLVGMTLHEFSHGVALVHYGGRPSRLGIMLFYLMPAFFCDVSDGWRLPHNWQRVRVALAGIAVQTLFGSATALAALATSAMGGPTSVQYGLLVVAAGNMFASLLNLIPFVKLDGYIALMSRVDIPHFRQRSMVEGRRLLARWLFGGRYEQQTEGPRWMPYFGVACMVFPIVLIAVALSTWVDLLARGGIVGAAALLVGAGCLAYYLIRGAIRVLQEGIRARANVFRMAATSLGVVAAVVFALHAITLPYTVSGGYLRTDEGTFLMLPPNQSYVDIHAGAELTLGRGGVLLQRQSGTAVVTSSDSELDEAPIAVLMPMDMPDVMTLPAYRYSIEVVQEPDQPQGVAKVHLRDVPLWEWIYLTYAEPVLKG